MKRHTKFDDYSDYDALGLAALIEKREITAADAVNATIERIERHNPAMNAIVFKAYDEARKLAKASNMGGFLGVPMLIKDLGLAVAGWPRTSGSRFTAGVVDDADCGLVTRYRDCGAIPVGRSASSEFGMIGTTETAAYGSTRNPWNLDHIAGGSSGGAAAAVAAGIVPVAHASDGLGSIRIPAACCGVVGLKPTRDRVPNLPDGGDYAVGFVCDHVLTRTVRDSAAMLDATGMPERGSPYATPPKRSLYIHDVERSPGRLRIHWSSDTVVGGPVDPEVQAVLEQTATTLAALGHHVVPGGLTIDEVAILQARLPVSGANFAAFMQRMITDVGREPESDELEPMTWAALKLSRQVTGQSALHGFQELRRLSRLIVRQFETIDVWLSPVMASPPPRIGTIASIERHPADTDRLQTALYPYALIFNFTGQPSISLPLGQSSTGLPIGMMLTARYGDEATLFTLAGQLEKEMPWAGRRPPVWN